jgi:thiamine monophosphate synthase
VFPRLQFLTLDASPLTHRAQALAALEGGVRWIQLRAKHLSEDVWIAEAAAIAEASATQTSSRRCFARSWIQRTPP